MTIAFSFWRVQQLQKKSSPYFKKKPLCSLCPFFAALQTLLPLRGISEALPPSNLADIDANNRKKIPLCP
jgi:hypothetical protein